MAERELVKTIDTGPLTAGEVILALFDAANEITPPEQRVSPTDPNEDIAEIDATARKGMLKIITAPLEVQEIMLPGLADAMKWRYKQLGYTLDVGEGDDDDIRIWKDATS